MTAQPAGPATEWVPVEHRFLGLDRRTLPPAAFALVVGLLLIYGWQVIAAAIPWQNEIRAGQVLDLGDGATAVPPVGWQLQNGSLTGGAGVSPTALNVLLAGSGITIEMQGTSFGGSPAEFLDQIQRAERQDPARVNGPRTTITTHAGLTGVAQAASSSSGDALDVAFKMSTGDPTAISAAPALLVRVRSAPGQLALNQATVNAVLNSITPGGDQ